MALHGSSSGSVAPLTVESANVVAQRNGTNSQTFYLFDSYTDASNYRRLKFSFSGGDCTITMESAGTGTAGLGDLFLLGASGKQLRFGGNAAVGWTVTSTNNLVAQVDATNDIGATGANRPRDLFLSRKIVTGDTVLHTTSTALTDAAGASAGTLTNAPTAGNPTKWITINDNGTTRKIPTWT